MPVAYVLMGRELIERSRAKVDIEDRGYNFGDGVYEVLRVYGSRPFAVQEHGRRLALSAAALRIALPYSLDELGVLLGSLIERNRLEDGLVYLQITRGVAPRRHVFDPDMEPVVTAFTVEAPIQERAQQEGMAAWVTADLRWLRCDVKTLNLLGSVLALRAAADSGCEEAILHRNGVCTECASSNLFAVRGDSLVTHPANHLILDGITRRFVLDVAGEVGMQVAERPFDLEFLRAADEVFLTNTFHEVAPVVRTEGDLVARFPVGPWTRRIQAGFRERVRQALTEAPASGGAGDTGGVSR